MSLLVKKGFKYSTSSRINPLRFCRFMYWASYSSSVSSDKCSDSIVFPWKITNIGITQEKWQSSQHPDQPLLRGVPSDKSCMSLFSHPSPEPLSFPFHAEREKTSNVPRFVLPLLLRTGFYCAGFVLWAGQCCHPASSTAVIVPLTMSPVPALFLPFLVQGNSTDYNQTHAKRKCS